MIRARNHYYYSSSKQNCCLDCKTNLNPEEKEKEKQEENRIPKREKNEESDSILAWLSKLTKKKIKENVQDVKDKEKNEDKQFPSLLVYSKIVKWINDAISPNDTRSYNPNPLFSFACRYKLLHKSPEEIYCDFVAYQCTVYAEADVRLTPQTINDTPFSKLQEWYEDLKDQTKEDYTCF